MKLSFFLSKAFLLNRNFLWLLFIVNFAGTIYGYMWYENQLIWTISEKSSWMIPFVPDSPTSSLFFSLSVLFLLFPLKRESRLGNGLISIINALGIVCSIKYGVWATAIIIAGAMQGDTLNWQSYMLMASHLAMAIEVVIYAKYMKLNFISFIVGLTWLLVNDTLDYTFGIYPWLPSQLHDQVEQVKWFTIGLSIVSFIVGWISWAIFRAKR